MAGAEMQFVESWQGWDEMDTACLYFYNVKVRPEVLLVLGDFQAVDMCLDSNRSIVEFYNDSGEVRTFKMVLQLGEEISKTA